MRLNPFVFVALFVLILAPASGAVTLEKFEATTSCNVTTPGEVRGKAVVFAAAETVDAVAFSAGAVQYRGESIDFNGHEQAFINSTYTGTVTVPNSPGQSVSITVDGSMSGAATASARARVSGVALGDDFSRESAETKMGGTETATTTVSGWNSSVVPGLNGVSFVVRTARRPISVDAATGTVRFKMEGSVEALSLVEDTDDGFAMSLSGLILLALGVLGVGFTCAPFRARD